MGVYVTVLGTLDYMPAGITMNFYTRIERSSLVYPHLVS